MYYSSLYSFVKKCSKQAFIVLTTVHFNVYFKKCSLYIYMYMEYL